MGTSMYIASLVVCAATVAHAGDPVPFVDEAAERGLVYPMMGFPPISGFYGFGAAFADLDGDGDPDAILLGRANGRVGVFENLGDGTFVDRSLTSGIPQMTAVSAIATADYDGDGREDLFISRIFDPSKLYRNLGGFVFADATEASGIDVQRLAKGVAWGDYDGDGWVDLFVCNYFFGFGNPTLSQNQLWRNRGDGTFEDVAPALGLANAGAALQAVWTDVDRDGDLDLYLSNDRGPYFGFPPNLLYRNDGGSFVEIGAAVGADARLFSMGLACGDFNADGFPDFYCTNTTDAAAPLFGAFPLLLTEGEPPKGPVYVQSQSTWGVAHPSTTWGWGAMFFDWDNDGLLDLHVCNQFTPNSLFANTGKPPAMDIAVAAGLAGPHGSGLAAYCAIHGDIDGDGDLDVLQSTLGTAISLFVNREGERRNAVVLRVEGEWPNTSAIGASVETIVDGRILFRETHAGGNGYLGQNERILHVGLGPASSLASAIVRWPGTGSTRVLTDIPANVRWTIPPTTVLGDGNRDGIVDAHDREALCASFGPVAPGRERLDLDGDFLIGGNDLLHLRHRLEADGGRWADLDGDGTVGAKDLAILLGGWGSSECTIDLDGDGTVDGADLAILLGSWG